MPACKIITVFFLLAILTACGGSSGSDTPELTNNVPLATSESASLTANEALDISLNASDSDGDTLTYSVTTAPMYGSVTVNGIVATYVPTTDYVGSDSFTFTANDGHANSNVATISLTISPPPNTVPVANHDSVSLIKNKTENITLIATDIDGDALTYSVTTAPMHGSVTVNGMVATYVPPTDYVGSDSFSFTVNDSEADSNVATISLVIAATSNVAAIINTVDGSVVEGVNIDVIDSDGNTLETLQSNSTGQFTATTKIETDLVFRLSKEGFANQVITAQTPNVADLTVRLDITMTQRNAIQILDIATGGTLNSVHGAAVIVNANSFVDAQGNQVTGNIDVTITPIDISNAVLLSAFPGQFTGISDTDGQSTAIATLGTVEFVFTQNGQPLQLADSATAQIEMPLFITTHPATNQPISIGDEIELWYLNEDTGIWHQEGTGTVVVNTNSPTGFALQATVSHFTWWNIDVPIPTFDLNVTINGTVNGGVATLHVDLSAMYATWVQNGNLLTNVGTSRHYIIPVSDQVCVWIEYFDINNMTALSPQQCISSPMTDGNYPITFNVATVGSLTLQSYNRPNYYTGQPMSALLWPLSLEASVSYTVTSGSLPDGVTIIDQGTTQTRLVGTPTTVGSHSITIEGTDSDGLTDSVTLNFTVSNPPPPTIFNIGTVYSDINTPISNNISSRVRAIEPVTSWTITNSDSSSVAAGVSISSAGLFEIDNFDGIAKSYRVVAYNVRGASNAQTINVQLTVTPVLESTAYFQGEYSNYSNVDQNLSYYNLTAPATSWNITQTDGSAVPTTVNLSDLGQLTLPGSETIRSYHVTATNSMGTSNVMVVSFEDMIGCPLPTCLWGNPVEVDQ